MRSWACSWAALLCALLGASVPSIRLSAVSGLALRSAPFLGRSAPRAT
ncbi:hypothetical protein SEA_FINNRY_130 [Mycobacterium phage Finnry]|nr:hypothetical protein SEA_FINNRY_130 [Mycobacterium phage Finnry]